MVLLAIFPEYQGGERLDLNRWDFVGCGVAFRNDDVRVGLKNLCDFLVNRRELFAVSTPWSVELDKNVFVVFKNKLLEVLGDNDFDWLVVGFRNWL